LTTAGILQSGVGIDSGGWGMGGKSPVAASEEQRAALTALAGSRDRGEADRARAVLLTPSGWTSERIAEAFGGFCHVAGRRTRSVGALGIVRPLRPRSATCSVNEHRTGTLDLHGIE
jgi:hypothetical protein